MTATLERLLERARDAGATVLVEYDQTALEFEGRRVIEFVTVTGLPGLSRRPMSAAGAADALRRCLPPDPADYWRKMATKHAATVTDLRLELADANRRVRLYVGLCLALSSLLIIVGVVL